MTTTAVLLDIATTARPSFELVTYTLPAHWASALINGDASGLSEEDEDSVTRFLKRKGNPHFVDVGQTYFASRCDALHQLPGEMADFTAHQYPRTPLAPAPLSVTELTKPEEWEATGRNAALYMGCKLWLVTWPDRANTYVEYPTGRCIARDCIRSASVAFDEALDAQEWLYACATTPTA